MHNAKARASAISWADLLRPVVYLSRRGEPTKGQAAAGAASRHLLCWVDLNKGFVEVYPYGLKAVADETLKDVSFELITEMQDGMTGGSKG